jgi:hypothetical protein
MFPFDRCVLLVSPFPPVGTVAAPCGSPAVPRLPRYYGVIRLLVHPFVPPPVDPRDHVPPAAEVRKEMESSLGFLDSPFGNMPRARDSGDSSTTSH